MSILQENDAIAHTSSDGVKNEITSLIAKTISLCLLLLKAIIYVFIRGEMQSINRIRKVRKDYNQAILTYKKMISF